MAKYEYCGQKPFYIGQHIGVDSIEKFLRRDKCVYDGSGEIWKRFCKGLKKNYPSCWRKLIKREVLFYSENITQKGLDSLESYFIKKEKSHYSYRLGGCNVLWGTANNFGSGSPMKDPMIAAKVTEQLKGRRGAKRSKEGKRNMSMAAKKSWKDAERRRNRVSKAVSDYMNSGGREHLSRVKKGRKFAEEHKRNIALNHADFSGSKHPCFGKRFKWINNGIVEQRLSEGLDIPIGFVYGRIKNK